MENEIMNTNEEVLEETAAAEEVVEDVVEEVEEAAETAKEKLLRKCNEVKASCRSTADRIVNDLKECDYNPYFKQTRTYKLEVYRNCNEEEPIDVYETTDVKCFSARALAVAGTAAALLAVATNCVVKKLLK
ncbi:MAG: hypothetical protein IJX80_03365 [Clostridia bacterium]|nr:hypothetical protein [Clostridia bacterium]